MTEYAKLRMTVRRYYERQPFAMLRYALPVSVRRVRDWTRRHCVNGKWVAGYYAETRGALALSQIGRARTRRLEPPNRHDWWTCAICGCRTLWGGYSRRRAGVCSNECYRLVKVRRVSMALFKQLRRDKRRAVQLDQLIYDVKRKVRAYEASQRNVSEGVRGSRVAVHQGHA